MTFSRFLFPQSPRRLGVVLASAVILASAVALTPAPLRSSPGQSSPTSGIDRRGIDASARPQDGLFAHANGAWLQHTPIPDDRSSYGVTTMLAEDVELKLLEIVEGAEANKPLAGSEAAKIADFFASYMDEGGIEARGLASLGGELEKVERIAAHADLAACWGRLETMGIDSPLAFYVGVDDGDSTRYVAVITQSGLSLPDRDYYLSDDAKYEGARAQLRAYIATLWRLSHSGDGSQVAEEIVALETRLAQSHWEQTRLRDAELRYNKRPVDQLESLFPGIAWNGYLQGVEWPAASAAQLSEINVETPSYVEDLGRIVQETPLETWRRYLRFRVLDAYADALGTEFVDAHFALYGRELGGAQRLKPRWKRALRALGGERQFGVLGDALGKLYVERYYPVEAARRMEDLVAHMRRAFELSIDRLTWMSPETKQRAQEKLAKISLKIGATSSWRDYGELQIARDDLLGNLLRSAALEHRRQMRKLDGPVDRSEWHMTPQMVNAYYNPSLNEIVFPAAILQPPFFNVDADDAANYGGIGSVIGHEISHAFDDQGAKYDAQGNLRDWWTDADRAAFRELGMKLVRQFDQFSPLPGKRVNGQLTLGENIADVSGLAVAHRAYLLARGDKSPPNLDGWTGDQRFFLSYAQCWRGKHREPELLSRLLVDPHAPYAYRTDAPAGHLDAFYEAFDVRPGDAMYTPPESRIRIW